jgi:integrase
VARTGKRRRLAKNIFRDGNGVSGIVTVRGHTEEHRFPPTATVAEIRRSLDARRRVLEQLHPETTRGTLADLVRKYLLELPAGPGRTSRSILLQPWVDAVGDRPFGLLMRSELTAVLERWRHAGLSASRANKRISALRVAWKLVAPDDALPHAIERVKRYREPVPVARGVPMALVTVVLEAMPPSASRARARVLAWTGQPPVRVMAIRPEHVRWDRQPPELYVSPRRKGAGSADAWLPLLPEAQTALRDLFARKACGPFHTSALARSLKRAVTVAQRTLRKQRRRDDAARLEGFRLYDLRHSLLTHLAVHSGDLYAVKEYAGHSTVNTTLRYVRGAASERTRLAIAGITGAVGKRRQAV